MMTHIALLRAVNLGPHNKVAMRDLCAFAAALGMAEPCTVLQSGNLVFASTGRTAAQLETLFEVSAAKRLGLKTDFFVRTADEWRQVIAANPFPAEAQSDPSHLVVMFCKQAPEHAAVAALQQAIAGREVVRARGREAYVTYPDGIGESRLTAALIQKMLGTAGTGRNWNTVRKLGALVGVA